MSVRVHLAAAYGAAPQEFSKVLENAGGQYAQQTGPWCWVQLSVWGVESEAIDNGLKQLPVPSFRMTTVDGAMWYLNLFQEGERRFTSAHVFSFLRPHEDTGRRNFLSELKDWDVYGIEVTKDLQRELKGLSFEDARQRYVISQAAALCDAFAQAGIPFPRDEMMAVLTGEAVTEEELGWDIGDMPRFLDVLGLGEVMPGWREQAENPEACEMGEGEEAGPEPDYAAELIDGWEGKPPQPVGGGPVECPVSALHRVCRLAWFCDEDVDAAIRIRLPDGVEYEPDFSSAQYARLWPADDSLHIGYAATGGKWDTLVWTAEAGQLLGNLPDGSQLELFTTEEEYEIGSHLYRGPVAGGVWRIEEVSPPANRKALEEALVLSRYVDEGGTLTANSPEEAEAIADKAIRLYTLGEGGLKKPIVKGKTLQLRGKDIRMERAFLALCAFRTWFQDTWDTREVDAGAEESQREWDDMIAAIGKKVEDAIAGALPQGDLVFKGRAATFTTVPRDPANLPEDVQKRDRGFADIGFACLGDMTCSAVPGVIIRGYASDRGDTWGVFMQSPFQEAVDLFTRFADGSSLTTTTMPGAQSEPERKVHKKHFRGSDIGKMHANHRKEVDQLREQCGEPEIWRASLAELAQAMDDFLVRSGFGS